MAATSGQLAVNVMHFARVLRTAGLPVGSDRVHTAVQALQMAGLESRTDFHAVLAACLLDRVEHRELFDQAFALFWLGPQAAASALALAVPGGAASDTAQAICRRLGEAMFPREPDAAPQAAEQPAGAGTGLAVNDREHLHQADFESMSTEEWHAAQRLLSQLNLVFEPIPTRRSSRAAHPGQADWRATLQAMARHGGELWSLRWRQRRTRPAPLVMLADISGSMSRYSRMLLHFGHLLGHADARVESFVFGTRLTRTTRLLRSRDPDLAVGQVVRAVQDWSGGTRITTSLHEFNQRWARRVLSGNATVLLVSDGLE
ncbi:MAG: VWA domain-containing protein, partial [Rubrivivax sp.]|nr:VWA domain-containing protein [Rubrivivax sp.]